MNTLEVNIKKNVYLVINCWVNKSYTENFLHLLLTCCACFSGEVTFEAQLKDDRK